MKGHTVGFLGPQIYILRQPFVLEAQTKTLEAGYSLYKKKNIQSG